MIIVPFVGFQWPASTFSPQIIGPLHMYTHHLNHWGACSLALPNVAQNGTFNICHPALSSIYIFTSLV